MKNKIIKKVNTPKKKVSKKSVPVVNDVYELSTNELLKDIMDRLTVLEAQEEKRDMLVKMMIENTRRLLREKELLLQHLGIQYIKESC